MTDFQKIIKYLAMAFAVFLTVSIIGGILSAVGLIGGIFGEDAVDTNVENYSVSSEINKLEIKINAADLTIKQGEKFSVESNLKNLSVNDGNGVLEIKETKILNGNYNGAKLVLYIPSDTVFEKVKINTGAGRLTVDSLSANTMDFELGAGEVTIDNLIASRSVNIEGGAGKITVSGGALCNLDLDMGVGKLKLTSALTGECELDLGVGESDITVLGNRDDYRLRVEKGIGSISVDGVNVSNVNEQGKGKNEIEVNGGVGSVKLSFNATDEK